MSSFKTAERSSTPLGRPCFAACLPIATPSISTASIDSSKDTQGEKGASEKAEIKMCEPQLPEQPCVEVPPEKLLLSACKCDPAIVEALAKDALPGTCAAFLGMSFSSALGSSS